MNKPLLLFTAPVGTRSGYGHHARDIVRTLIDMDKFDIKIMDLRWGGTPRDALKTDNPDHIPIIQRLLKTNQLPKQPEIHVHLTVPNEYQPIAKYNIGITAGIETTMCSPEWIEGLNRMNLNIVPSTHARDVFQKTTWTQREQGTNRPVRQLKLEKPIEVLFEGTDTNVYHKLNKEDEWPKAVVDEMKNVKTSFNFLFVGHWLKGELGQDRKDVGMLVKVFLDSFKGQKNPPGLILKTSGAGFSVMDREEIMHRINVLKNMSGNDNLPPIYLLHGELTDEEMNALYNHPKVKAHISFTKGEGFCVKDYTKIITENGLKRIDEITIGETVLTHTGQFKKVIKPLKRQYNNEMIGIKTYNGNQLTDLLFTPNHNIYVYNKKSNIFSWKPAGELQRLDKLVQPLISYPNKYNEILISDYIINQKNMVLKDGYFDYIHSDKQGHKIKNEIPLNKSFGKIIGYYLSEGCLSGKDGVAFSFNIKEKETLVNELANCFQDVFNITNYSLNIQDNKLTITFWSKILNNFFYNFAGKLANGKFINDIIINSNDEFRKNIITSLLLGDGCIGKDEISIELVNKNIIENLRSILLQNYKIITTTTSNDRREDNENEIHFNFINHRCRIQNKDGYNKIIKWLNENHLFCNYDLKSYDVSNKVKNSKSFILDNYLISTIRSISTEDFNGTVYNLSVEEDESYATENFVVHNCRPLLEATLSGKPVIAPGYSGQLDFLQKPLATLLPGQLTNVHKSAVWDKVILKESQWFSVNYNYASAVIKDVFKNYQKYELNAKKLAKINKTKFTREKMKEEFEKILDKYLPEFPKETSISLPNLPKLTKKGNKTPKVTLPKLGTGSPDLKKVKLPKLQTLDAEEPNHGSGIKSKDEIPTIKLPKLNMVGSKDEEENSKNDNKEE